MFLLGVLLRIVETYLEAGAIVRLITATREPFSI